MPHTRPNITEVQSLFRPERIAQVIENRESYGTPVTDTFYPERTRDYWDDVTVPVEEITRVTRAVPLVLRGAPGISVPGDGSGISLIRPQPIKTVDGMGAAEYNNRRLLPGGRQSVQNYADRISGRHVDIHRKTREALGAQSLTGRIDYPIADKAGTVVDVFSVKYGDVHAWTPSADWTLDATDISVVHLDLSNLKTARARRGYATTDIYVGRVVFAALIKKVNAISNDTRVPARVREDGGIQIGSFVLMEMAAQYDHPGLADFGQPGGAVAAGFKDVIGDTELLAVDSGAPWRLLSVRLDQFGDQATSALSVIAAYADDMSQIDLFIESKPFFIPPAPAISRGDASST